MKTRITIMAENSKPFDPKHKDALEAVAKAAWQYLLNALNVDPDDKVVVEKVEILASPAEVKNDKKDN